MIKKCILPLLFVVFTTSGYAQYRWELTGGLLFSKINYENAEVDFGTGYQINGAYEYLLDQRARTGLVFSIELLQRKSRITAIDQVLVNQDIEALQFGFSPKFRYYFGKEVRPYLTVGPSFRYTSSVKIDGEKLDKELISNEIMLGAHAGAGVVVNVGERFFLMSEAGVMLDFLDVLKEAKSTFFDLYFRVGIRYRPK